MTFEPGIALEALQPVLAYIAPSWLLALLLALLNVLVFRIAVGREGRTSLYFLPWGVFGFALGNLLAVAVSSLLPTLGDVRVIEASVGAWLFLTIANSRVPA